MAYAINIFDQFGGISENLDEKEIAKCSEEQKAVLFKLLDAWANTKAADKFHTDAVSAKNKAETALARAEKVLIAVTPVYTAHMAWQRSVGIPVAEPDAALIKKIKAAEKARDGAQEVLALAITEVYPTQVARDEHRKNFVELLRDWQKVEGRPRSVADLVKERSRVETKQKLALIEQGLDPETSNAIVSNPGPSHLDRFRAGQGRGSSVNVGYHRNALRGYAPTPKLPSER
jgi:hypothetical protein